MTTDLESVDRASSARERIIEVEDLNVSYDMDRGVAGVLNDVDFAINRDEIVGIVGESGSGKSMFASALLDAVPEPGQTTGRVTYYPADGGEPVDVLDLDRDELRTFRWEEVAMVFQGAMNSFNPTLSIRGHFEETIEAHDMDMVEQMRHARQLISDLYLDPDRVLDSYPHELSGGMRQRALIALSLVLEPDVLVMDEPTAALDLLMQRSITRMIWNLRNDYGLTIIFITHDLPLISGLVDRLAVLYAFEFIEVGEKADVLLDAGHPYTRELLGAAPSIDTDVDEMEPIEGQSPDPINIPEGCTYAPRCPLADDQCREHEPPFHVIEEGHEAKCYYWEEARDAIHYSLGEEEDQ